MKLKAEADNPYRDLDYNFWISQNPNLIIVLLHIEGSNKLKVMCLLLH